MVAWDLGKGGQNTESLWSTNIHSFSRTTRDNHDEIPPVQEEECHSNEENFCNGNIHGRHSDSL